MTNDLRLASCEGKQRFRNFTLAYRIAKSRRRSGKQVEPYRCRFCGAWHIGCSGVRR